MVAIHIDVFVFLLCEHSYVDKTLLVLRINLY